MTEPNNNTDPPPFASKVVYVAFQRRDLPFHEGVVFKFGNNAVTGQRVYDVRITVEGPDGRTATETLSCNEMAPWGHTPNDNETSEMLADAYLAAAKRTKKIIGGLKEFKHPIMHEFDLDQGGDESPFRRILNAPLDKGILERPLMPLAGRVVTAAFINAIWGATAKLYGVTIKELVGEKAELPSLKYFLGENAGVDGAIDTALQVENPDVIQKIMTIGDVTPLEKVTEYIDAGGLCVKPKIPGTDPKKIAARYLDVCKSALEAAGENASQVRFFPDCNEVGTPEILAAAFAIVRKNPLGNQIMDQTYCIEQPFSRNLEAADGYLKVEGLPPVAGDEFFFEWDDFAKGLALGLGCVMLKNCRGFGMNLCNASAAKLNGMPLAVMDLTMTGHAFLSSLFLAYVLGVDAIESNGPDQCINGNDGRFDEGIFNEDGTTNPQFKVEGVFDKEKPGWGIPESNVKWAA